MIYSLIVDIYYLKIHKIFLNGLNIRNSTSDKYIPNIRTTINETHTSSDSERNSCMMSLSPITRTEQTRIKHRDRERCRERGGGQSKSNKQRTAKCNFASILCIFHVWWKIDQSQLLAYFQYTISAQKHTAIMDFGGLNSFSD